MTVVVAFVLVSSCLALVQVLALWSGALGMTVDRGVAVALLAAAGVGGLLLAMRFATGLRRAPDAAREPVPVWYRLLRAVLGLGVVAALAWFVRIQVDLWNLAARRAVLDWDGLYYHIPAMHGWAVAGRVTWLHDLADIIFGNGYPMAVETFTWLLHYVLGTSDLVDAANLWFWPLGATALATLAHVLGARGIWPWLAAALLGCVPVVVCQSVTCYVDPAFACTVMGAVAASCLLVFHDGRLVAWRAVLWGFNLGLMTGAKGTGAPFAMLLAAAVAVAILLREGLAAWRVWWPRLAVAVVACFLVSGFWYGRNLLETGNPIHPIQVAFGENVLIPGYDPAAMLQANQPPWLTAEPAPLRVFVAWTQPDAPVSGYAPTTGLGRIWLYGGVPAVLLLWARAWRRRREESLAPLLFLTVLVLLLLAVQPARWWGRMTIWLHALGLPALAAVASHAVGGLRRAVWPAAVLAGVAAVVVLGIRETDATRDLEWQAGRAAPTIPDGPPGDFLSTRTLFFGNMDLVAGSEEFWAARRIARSRWGRVGTLLGGTLGLPLGRRELRLLPDAPTAADLEALRRDGFTWVVWDVEGAGEVPETVRAAALQELVHHPTPDTHFRLLRLR